MKTGLQSGLRSGLLSGLNPSTGVAVPTDGPSSVYIPTTTAHFSALSIPSPTDAYACDEASGDLAPSIGLGDLATVSTGHLYEQSVTGWSSSFTGTTLASGAYWAKTNNLSAGESYIVLAYTSFDAGGALRNLFHVAGSSDRMLITAAGEIRAIQGGSSVIATGVDHDDIATVHPVLLVRDATNNLSGAYSDIAQVANTHSEAAASGDLSIPQGTDPDMRLCRFYHWRGAEADALITAGLANETLLEALGWTLSY